jgi:hypothetical protein
MWRKILGGVAGYLGWWVIGTIGFVSLRVLWPDYASVEQAMTFTVSMQISRLLVGLLCSFGAGIIVYLVVRERSIVPWVLGIVLLIQFLVVHYFLWAKFPIWYHAFFLLTLAPAVVLGSRWAASWNRQKGTSPTTA